MAADGSSAITAAWRCTAFATVRERELQFADLQPALERGEALEATLRLREELAEQRRALLQMQEMAARYGCDISHRRALPGRRCSGSTSPTAAVKSQNGGAMSLGRTATFLDIYIERDLRAGLLNEEQARGAH